MTKPRKAREWWIVMNMKFGHGKIYENPMAAYTSEIMEILGSEVVHIREVIPKKRKK